MVLPINCCPAGSQGLKDTDGIPYNFRPERDELYTNVDAKNIVVMKNGYFYSFDVLDANGK